MMFIKSHTTTVKKVLLLEPHVMMYEYNPTLIQPLAILKGLYKSCSIKQIIFNNYATNLKTIVSHRSLRISSLLIFEFFILYFEFLIDIIDNIITYSPYYVTITSANDKWCRRKSRDQYTALSFAEVLVTLYGLYELNVIILSITSIKNAK